MKQYVSKLIALVQSRTGRLSLTYLAIIVSMTLIFSGIIYSVASSQFDKPLRPRMNNPRLNIQRPEFEQILRERAQDARTELVTSLLLLNLTSLLFGAVLSYYLARKTLAPIEQSLETQARFVSDASHELRTPLTTLQVTNEIALRKKKLSLADAKELIQHNLAETVKLRDLSNSLLGIIKQESASTAKEKINLRHIMNDILVTISVAAHQKNIVIKDLIPSATLEANASSLSQILIILIDNAINYSPEKSTITLTVSERRNETVISVADMGKGIPREEQAKIFDRFYRVDESRSSLNVRGTGLGLSIAKAICDRQGMSISLKSTVEEGSVFSLHIKS